jgi:carbonic anhydrase
MVGFAGSSKDLETIMKQIEISVRLHQIKEVILINHEDCGAYGKESTFEKHSQDLKNAKQKIQSLYPDLKTELYYLKLNGQFDKIK